MTFNKRYFWVVPVVVLLCLVALAMRQYLAAPEPTRKQAPLGSAQLLQNKVEYARAKSEPVVKPVAQATKLRANIWDAADVMAEVKRVRTSGTPDEKWYAGEVLRECFALTLPQPEQLKDDEKSGVSKQDQRDAWTALAKALRGAQGAFRA